MQTVALFLITFELQIKTIFSISLKKYKFKTTFFVFYVISLKHLFKEEYILQIIIRDKRKANILSSIRINFAISLKFKILLIRTTRGIYFKR